MTIYEEVSAAYRNGRTAYVDSLAYQALVQLDVTSDVIIVVAGLGTGKSRGCVVDKSILLAAQNWPVGGLVLEPTLRMVKGTLLDIYEESFRDRSIPWRYHKSDHIISYRLGAAVDNRWARITLGTGEHPERLKGPNLAYVIIDEAGIQHPDVWKHAPSRVRHPRARVPQFVAVGTPEGYGEFYAWAEGQWGENPIELGGGLTRDALRGLRRVVRASTLANTFLVPSPAEYIAKRLGHLKPADLIRYRDGLFVPAGQRVYSFERALHGKRTTVDPFTGEIVVGADFNVGKMCWVIGSKQGERMHMWGELVRRNTNTRDQASALVDYVRDAMDRWNPRGAPHPRSMAAQRIRIAVDPHSASARHTSATETDVEAIHRAGIADVYDYGRTIPIKDRVESLDWRIRDGMYTVDVEACPNLVATFEQQGRDEYGYPVKAKGEADLSGCGDGAGYGVWSVPHWRSSMPTGNTMTMGGYV